jgi:hypothetical protein
MSQQTPPNTPGLIFDWNPPKGRSGWLLLSLLLSVATMAMFSIALSIRPPEVTRTTPRSERVILLNPKDREQAALIRHAMDRSFPIINRRADSAGNSKPAIVDWPSFALAPAFRPVPPSRQRAATYLSETDFTAILPTPLAAEAEASGIALGRKLHFSIKGQRDRQLVSQPEGLEKWMGTEPLGDLSFHVAVDEQGRVQTALIDHGRSLPPEKLAQWRALALALRFSVRKASGDGKAQSYWQWLEIAPRWVSQSPP